MFYNPFNHLIIFSCLFNNKMDLSQTIRTRFVEYSNSIRSNIIEIKFECHNTRFELLANLIELYYFIINRVELESISSQVLI